MATVLDVIRGLNQAAANAYDGALDENGEALKIGLNREEGDPIIDSRLIDGFKVRFAGPKMIVTYQSEMRVDELHPRNQFENEIDAKFADITKFLKKEYKNITKSTVSLTEDSDADIMVQTTMRPSYDLISDQKETETTEPEDKALKAAISVAKQGLRRNAG